MRHASQKLAPAGLMLALACNRLANALAADDVVWRIHDITLSAALAFAALWALQLVSYRDLRIKCAAAAIFGLAASDAVMVAVTVPGYWYWIVIQLIAGTAMVLFYLFRSYDQPSDPLDGEHIFCLRAKPLALQDLLISMTGIFGSNGGYAIYAGGTLYQYRRGRLVAQSIDRLPPSRYHVTRGALVTESMISELQHVVGSRWTWRHNCLTVLGPIWSRYSG